MLSSHIADILACPYCVGELKNNSYHVYCPKCDKQFSVKDNIPILLQDELIDFNIETKDFSIKRKRFEIEFFSKVIQNDSYHHSISTSISTNPHHDQKR